MVMYEVSGEVVLTVYVKVEADSEEEAVEKVEDDNMYVTEYCDGTVGVDGGDYEVTLTCCDNIEWGQYVEPVR